MKKTKIYNVLAHFNKYEQNRLRKFLLSPYFNSDESIVLLFDLIVKYLNGSQKKVLTKEKLWEKLSKAKTYDDGRFRKYCSDLLKNVESFLAIEFVENDKITKSHLTLNALKYRKIENLYSSFIRSSKNFSNKNPDKSSNFHLNQFLVEKNLYELNQSELKRLNKSNIDAISDSLDKFYFSEKLRFYSAAIFQKRFIKDAYKLSFIEDLLPLIKESPLLNIPSISIYYYSYLTVIENDNINHFFKLKELLSENAMNFPKNEALSLYYFAANYCIGKHNKGVGEFTGELFNTYKEMVDKEIILSEHNEISPWDFKNIITIGLYLTKLDWTENFINEFGPKIPNQYRENSVRYNLGQLYFAQKKYDNVLEQLHDFESDDLLASLSAKTITVCTYYDIDEIDLLFSYIESFRVYLGRKSKRKEINKDRQVRYLNFLNLVKKMTRIIPGEKKSVEKLENEFLENKKKGLIIGTKWLKEKFTELK